MILISDPMYNEPGYEGMKGTEEGEARSREYNANLRLMTLRHAMLGPLRNPPIGKYFFNTSKMMLNMWHSDYEI